MQKIYFLSIILSLLYGEKYQAGAVLQTAEEGIKFISDLTGQLAQDKIEHETLKTEIIQLARKNTDIKLNQAVKIKNIIAITSLKMKLILSMHVYAQYEEEIAKTLQNKIDKMFQEINKLSNNNLHLLENTPMKELVSVYNYILEDGFNNYFYLYEEYINALDTMNVVFNNVISDDHNKNAIMINTDSGEAMFTSNMSEIITKIQNEYTKNMNKNTEYKINIGRLRNYLKSVFFRVVDDINKKIDDLLVSESKKDITDASVPFYDLTLVMARLGSILVSKIDTYEHNLKAADDNFYKMYFILKKIFVQNNWIIKSLKSNNVNIATTLEELKKNITKNKTNNDSEKSSFVKAAFARSIYFESLIKSLNDFVKKLVHYSENKIKEVFQGNLDPDAVLKKLNDITGWVEEDLLEIEKRKNFIINQLSLLYNIALIENDLTANIRIYRITQDEKASLTNLEKSILKPNLSFHKQMHFTRHGQQGPSHQKLKSKMKHEHSKHDPHKKTTLKSEIRHEQKKHNLNKKKIKY